MIKHTNKYSMLIIVLLLVQLVTPFMQVYAADIQSPTGFSYSLSNGNDVKLRWNHVTDASEYHIYEIENGNSSLRTSTRSNTFTMTNVSEGYYSYEIVSYNEGYGESTPPSTLSFNLVYPSLEGPQGLVASVKNGNDLYLNWKPSEFATSYEVYQLIDGEKVLVDTVSTQYISVNMPEGQYAYEVYAISDRFGKSTSSSYVEYTLVHPTMDPPPYAKAVVEDIDNVLLTWNASNYATKYYIYQMINGEDVLIGETKDVRYFRVQDLPEGNHVFKIKSYSDRFGVSASAIEVSTEIVNPVLGTPQLSLQTFDGQNAKLTWGTIRYANSYDFYEIINGQEIFVQSTTGNTITLDNLETGTHQYIVRAVSETLGESENSNAVSFEVLYDIKAPITTTNSSPSWTNKDVMVELTATDDKSGVDKTLYSFSNEEGSEQTEGNSFTISKEGITTYYYSSVDNAGNKENMKSAMIRLDKTPPVTTSNAAEGWHDTFALEMAGDDDLSGLYTTFYSINGEDFRVGNLITLTKKGEYTVSFYSMDKAGNKEAVQTVQLKINGVETPEEEEPVLGNSGLQGEEVEELLGFIGNDPTKIEELETLEQTYPLPIWDPSQKNEQLPQIEDFLNGLKDITGVEVNIKTGKNESVTIDELIAMDEINSDIVIEITTPDGEFIADIVLPIDTPKGELVVETPVATEPIEQQPSTTPTEDIDGVRDEDNPVTVQESGSSPKTVNGAELPKTASNMLLNILLGLVMILIGALVFLRNAKSPKGSISK